jgi:predicted O-methyltransferase YrrM
VLEESTRGLSLGDLVRVVQASDQGVEAAKILDPAFYYEFLARCCQRQIGEVRHVKGGQSYDDRTSKRFSCLVEVLERGVPSLPIESAREIGRVADRLRFDPSPIDVWIWDSDVGIHFELSSSYAAKGRILSAAVRVMRPQNCLELGTAYGMSSLFVLSQLASNRGEGKLTTVELFEPQFGIASSLLRERYEDHVDCRKIEIGEGLPGLAGSLGAIDFAFHDSEHTGESYVRDFQMLEPHMAPGGVILFDDIRWTHPEVQDTMGCYAGWQQIITHDRVRRAIEIDDNLGMLQLV